MNRISDLRQLCRLIDASARLAEIDGQCAQSHANGLDVIRVANQGTRGGLLIDVMAGFACEWVGQRALARFRDQLSAEECRTLVTALAAIDDQQRADRKDRETRHGLGRRAAQSLHPDDARCQSRVNLLLQPAIDAFELASKRAEARLRLLIAELAVRRYRLEKGNEPPNLEALVPRYLAQGSRRPVFRSPDRLSPGPKAGPPALLRRSRWAG